MVVEGGERLDGLPPGAIIVNHMNQINYAINPHSAAINAVWSGDSLDIGPNIYARGQKAAAFLGKQLMAKSKSIELLIDGSSKELAFVGYSDKPRPKFIYKYENVDIHVESRFEANKLIISYSSPTAAKLSLKVPDGLNSKVIKTGSSLLLSIPLEVK